MLALVEPGDPDARPEAPAHAAVRYSHTPDVWTRGCIRSVRRLDPPALYAALDMERARRGLTWNQVVAQVGVSVGTIRRERANGRFEIDGIVSLTQWLGRPVEEFTRQSSL